jgi:hypothetical protein
MAHTEFLRWPAVDRAKAIAFFYEKSARCVMCGTAQWEWDENPNAYQATTEFCPGCYRKDAANDSDEPLPAGASITLISTESPQWQRMLDENEAEFRAEQAARVRARKGLSDG